MIGDPPPLTQPTSPAAPRHPFAWRFMTPVLLGSTLNPINTTMIATALVGIGTSLGAGPSATAGLISILYLASSISQPTLGKISTLIGARRTFLIGICIVFAGGVVGVLAPNLGWLLLSRALIGIGTSAGYPTAMALIRQRADSSGLGAPTTVLGNLSIAAQVTGLIGLPLGGILVGVWGWRAVFFVNIPLALITFTLTLIGVPRDAPRVFAGVGDFVRALDLPGIALFGGAIASALVFLADLSSPRWWLVALFAVLAVGLYFWERRVDRPLIDVRMLAANRPLQRTYLRNALSSIGAYAVLLGMSQWMEQSRGLSPSVVGLVLLPLSVMAIIGSRIVSRGGWVRWPVILGGAGQAIAGLVMLALTKDINFVALVGFSLLLGLYGFSTVANQAALYLQAPPDQIAVSSGLMRTAFYLGAIFSSSLLGIVYGDRATDAGLHTLGPILAGIGALVVVLGVFDRAIPWSAKEGTK